MKSLIRHLILACVACLLVTPLIYQFETKPESEKSTPSEEPSYVPLNGQDLDTSYRAQECEEPPQPTTTINAAAPATTTDETLQTAINLLSKEIRRHPRRADTYIERGWEYSQLGHDDLAIADYNKAISLKPRDSEAYVKRAWAYCDLRLYGRAVKDATKALRLDPKDMDAYDVRAAAYSSLGNVGLATKDYDSSMRLMGQ